MLFLHVIIINVAKVIHRKKIYQSKQLQLLKSKQSISLVSESTLPHSHKKYCNLWNQGELRYEVGVKMEKLLCSFVNVQREMVDS